MSGTTAVQNKISITKNRAENHQSQVNPPRNSLKIATPKEFNFGQCLKFLGRSSQERLHFINDSKVRKVIKFGSKRTLIELGVRPDNSLEVEFLNNRPDQAMMVFVQQFVHDWFDLGRDLAPFYEMAARDKLLKNLVHRFYGLRMVKIHDLFQGLAWAILGQQINLAFAYTLYRRFIESYGEKYSFECHDYWLFPTPEAVAKLSVSELMKLQLTGNKAEYIIRLARQMEDGNLSKQSLVKDGNFAEAKNTLLKIHGVGPWTANYVLMRCLGDPSAFPIEDVGLHNAIKLQLNLKNKPTIAQIQKLAAGWTDWQGYAAFYLYRSLYD